MGDLFLNIYSSQEDIIEAPIETVICLVIVHYLKVTNVDINFVKICRKDTNLKLLLNGLKYKIINDIPPPASFCALPAFNLDDGISCVAGFCTVLRQIIKCGGEKWTSLLGFRQACLVACAEVSVWTKFCEVDLISAAEKSLNENLAELPVELARLECHLKQPIRVHNVRKYKNHEHKYVEGPNFLLTDLLAAIPTYIIMDKLNIWDDTLPLTKNWILNVINEHDFKKELDLLIFDRNDPKVWTIPDVPNESLYKRDPTRYKPRHKIFTQQSDIDKSMEIISKIDLFEYLEPVGSDIVLNDDIPKPDVPEDRSERKLQQLVNLVKSALKISADGDIIVDFCSGSGHLGLILAHCLPKSKIVLLDNKETSLARAKEKLVSLNIKNIYIVQANLDYYIGKFQVGVSLHACGVASDLVIQKCIKSQANFVVCPCCYGGIQKNHILNYPQSDEYRNIGLDERSYIVLGHCADQGSEQGERGMQAVDTDRCLLAHNKGYEVSLSKLIPPSCTTRNNMIVATISQ